MEATKLKVLYAVTTRGERSFWTKIGMAYMNRDGSMTLSFDAFPANNNKVQMRDYTPRDVETGELLPSHEQGVILAGGERLDRVEPSVTNGAPAGSVEAESPRAKVLKTRRMTVEEALP